MSFPASPWTGSIAAVAAVSGLPLLVTLLMAQRETMLRRILPGLSAFGAGAVFAAAVGHIIPESLKAGQSAAAVAAGVLGGYALFWAMERLLAHHDHAHAHGVALGAPSAHATEGSEAACVHLHPTPAGSPSQSGSRALVPMTFIGDAVHNLVDGMLIAAGFMTGPSVGVLTLMAVALHELPRELGTFGLFVHGGIRPMRAVVYNLLTAVLAMAGAALTLLLGTRITALAAYLLPVAAGTYLYIAGTVGRAALHDRHRDSAHWTRLAWSGLGIALTLGSTLLA
jgi:zinc and cadmium transporter